MRVCGVTIQAKNAIFVVVDHIDGDITVVAGCAKKIELKDDRNSSAVRSFAGSIEAFASDNKITVFAVKSRQSKGQMASGGITFKIEGLVQMQSIADVEFVSPQALTKIAKSSNLGAIPKGVAKYQSDAFLAAVSYLKKAGLL